VTAADPALLVDADGPVLHVTLNRPRQGNAIDLELARSLSATFEGLDPSVSVVVLRANGKVFCAGGDVHGFAAADDAGAFIGGLAGELHRGLQALQASPVPVVAAVQGNAGGAGIGLLAACDVVVSIPTARFRPAYIALGLTPDAGLTWRLAAAIGPTRTLDLLMTDGELSAPDALAAGLVSRVVDDVDAEVDRVIAQLSAGPTEAYARLKSLVHGAEQRSLAEQLELEAAGIAASAGTAAGREGIAAFTERRPPNFAGETHATNQE
jgi:2-(1,2-epoxy-1,2-dihydrophenyl)acetyl-CoA isomerase